MGTSAEPVSRRIEQEAVSEAGERSSIIKADKKAGKLVGPYLVGELIGEGTQGKVKEAVHSETLRRVAIKIVNKLQLRKIKNAEENMKRELKIHRRLKHEHVVELLEVLEVRKPDKEKQYIVLELINGGSLQDILDELPTRVLPSASPRASAASSSAGWSTSLKGVHRDIKPSNLMVTSDGMLKIMTSASPSCWTVRRPPPARPPARPPAAAAAPPPPRRRRRARRRPRRRLPRHRAAGTRRTTRARSRAAARLPAAEVASGSQQFSGSRWTSGRVG